jgi:integrase
MTPRLTSQHIYCGIDPHEDSTTTGYEKLTNWIRLHGNPIWSVSNGNTPATRGVRLHDLRHTFATMQLMAGTHFMQLSKRLGHSTLTLTFDTSADWAPRGTAAKGTTCPSRQPSE